MKKRIIALILVMTMVWGSMGDLFTGLSFTARADEQDLATPTDLSPLPQEGQRMTLMRSAAPGTGTDNDAVATTVLSTNNTAGTNNDAAATTVLSANNTAGTNNDAAATSVLSANNAAGTDNDTVATSVLSANNAAGTDNDAAAISVLGADNTAGTNNDTNTNNNTGANNTTDTNTGSGEEETKKTEASKSPLQQLINDKIGALKDLTGKVMIVLAKNVTFEGDAEIAKKEDQTVAEDFQLELVAEDALDDQDQVIPAGGSGKTVIGGNLNIKGISVLLRGVVIAVGKAVTVSEAKLNYEGTNEADVLKVDLGKDGSAEINTYGKDDNVTVTMFNGAKDAKVNTGEGDDSVSLTAYDGTAQVATGEGDDAVKLNLQNGAGEVKLDTEAGNDSVEAKVLSSGGTEITTGEGADKTEISAAPGADKIKVSTGAGDDRVTVTKAEEDGTAPDGAKMEIDLGSGADRLDVDVSVGKAIATITAAATDAAKSRLHLTGELNKEEQPITWASDAKTAIKFAIDGAVLTIEGIKNFGNLTDTLENKKTKTGLPGSEGFEDFTDYKLSLTPDAEGYLSWNQGTVVGPVNPALINLVLSAGENGQIKVRSVTAKGFNLLIKGKQIDLNGTVKANNIIVSAKDGKDDETIIDPNSESVMDKAEDILKWVEASISPNVTQEAVINVQSGAKLIAAHDIDLTAKVTQNGGLLAGDLISGIVDFVADGTINPVNVKIGSAQVNIQSGAELTAGYGEDGTGSATSGSINAEAKISANAAAGGDKALLPIAVSVAVEKAAVNVEKGAALKAAENIRLNAESKVEAGAESSSKLAPFAVAVDVAVNSVITNVKGTLTAGKDATVSALGEIKSDAAAKHSEGKSGLFLGVNVTLQDVKAQVDEGAAVTAGGNVNVKSTANLTANTVAKSGNSAPEKEDGDDDSDMKKTKEMGLGMARELLGGIWKKLSSKVQGLFKNDETTFQKLDKQMQTVAGNNYSVKLAEGSEQKGDVKFTTETRNADSSAGQTSGVYTLVQITPWPGHKVNKVYYAYVENKDDEDAATKYTVKEAGHDALNVEDDVWLIPQENADVLVIVTYTDDNSEADEDAWNPDDLFNQKDDDDYGEDLQRLFDDATGGAQNSDADEAADNSEEETAAEQVKFVIEEGTKDEATGKTVGAILNTRFRKDTGEGATTAAKGGKVTFTVNAKKGYKLKDDGLVISYYVEGEEKEQKTVLKDDGNGRYTFTVPDQILTNKYDDGVAFKVISEFEKADEESGNETDQTRNQVNGAVAVSVALNDNRAEILKGAAVKANGKVNVAAAEETKVNTNTDGSGVEKNPKKESEKEKEKKQEQKQVTQKDILPEQKGFKVDISYNALKLSEDEDPYGVGNKKIGNVYYVKSEGTGESTKLFFSVKPDGENGYTAKDADIQAVYKDGDGVEHKVALTAAGNYWTVQKSDLKGLPDGATVTISVKFTEDEHEIQKATGFDPGTAHGDLSFSKEKGKATDTITITAKPDKNYGIAGKITVKYTKASGTTETKELTPDEKGEVKFTVPADVKDKIYVTAAFSEKSLTLTKDEKSTDISIVTTGKVNAGEKIEVKLTDAAAAAGKKLSGKATVTYTDDLNRGQTVIVDVKDGKITLPDDIKNNTNVKITLASEDKAIKLSGGEAKLDHGTLKIAALRADKGEKVTVNITPESGYRFKQGSGTVEITTSTSSYKLKLTRKDDNSLTFTMPSSMTSAEMTAADVKIVLKGEFEEGLPDSSAYETSFGAAAAVAIVNSKNNAQISGGTVEGKTVKAEATTVGESKVSASAGYSKAATGLAGGFGVNVASFDTKALVKKEATVKATDLEVTATGSHGLETSGSAAGAKDAATTGIGSGIAVNVSSADVAAGVQDGANVTATGSVTVSAANKSNDKVTAKAGATAETGITPVVALDVFGSGADAYLGNSGTAALTAKTVSVTASNTATHEMTADASTGGGKVALGGAFAIAVIHDEALARLNRSVTNAAADSAITVSATTNTTQSITATAGVAGGVKGSAGKNGGAGSADKQVDSILGGAGNIASKSKSSSLSLKGSGSADRQKAQTSEGSIGGAAAIAVNVLGTSAKSRIMDQVNIDLGGAVNVKSVNRTESKIKANGSTAKTDTGVGVAAALNIIDLEITAEIGNGSLKAGSVTVSAKTPEKADNTVDETTTVKMPESKDKMVEQLAGYIRDTINEELADLGVDQSVIGELAGEFSGTFIEYVLKETGLEDLLGDGTFEEKTNKVLGSLEELWGKAKEYPGTLLQPLADLKDEIAALKDIDTDKLKNLLLDELKERLPNLLKNAVTTVLEKAKDDLGALALEAVNDKLKGKDMSSLKEKAGDTLKNAIKAVWTQFSGELLNDTLNHLRSQIPVLTQENIDRIKYVFTSSLDDKKGDFVDYLTGTFQNEVFDYAAVMDKIRNTDFKQKAKDIMRGALKASVTKIGDTAISKLVDNLDVKLEPEDVSDKHVIRTEAIAGAAAKDVGIAGAVAITILNASTTATINSGSAMKVTGDVTVEAQEARRVNTVASAALDAKGNADKNKDGGKKDEKDTAGGGDAAPTIHLGDRLQVKATAGAKLTQDDSDRDIIWIEALEGWKITEGADKAEWSYTDESGKEKTGKVRVYSKNGKYYVDASDVTTAEGRLTTITVKPEEDLHTITGLDAINFSEEGKNKGKVPDGAVSVTVEGRDDPVKDGKLTAKTADTVKIAINKSKIQGLRVESITYFIGSEMHEVPLSSTENGDEIVFTFKMPAKNVTGILVEMDKAEEADSNDSKTAATDSKGRSVGVGASFAMVYGDSSVSAGIRRDAEAGTVTVSAESDHKEETVTVSGTDPLSGELDTDATKKTAVDASVALDILDNEILATLTGTVKTTKGDLNLTAKETGISDTQASGYAVGSATAVGAAAAVNIASSTVTAEAQKDLTAAGAAKIEATSHSEDTTKAFATAMGADIARNLNKVGEKAEKLEEKSNDLLTGKVFDENKDKGDSNKNNKTADKINARMDKKKSADGGEDSSKNLSVSSNALRNQNVTTASEDSGKEGTDEAVSQIGANTDSSISNPGQDTKKKIQVAAAVGVTVASHEAGVKTGKITAGNGITAAATNNGNFNTMGTGAAMSLAEKANSIAFGVAVSVNANKANVKASGDLASTNNKDISLTSTLTQNMDGEFRGKLAAQALAGSVAGKNSSISMGGAVSVVVANAESKVDIAGGKSISGGNVTIEATDKSKLAARAGGISLSKGSSVGMGIASTTVISSNEVTANVGDGATITADSFKLNAEKKAVTNADYKSVIDWSYLITDSSKLSDDQRKEADTGLIDVHKGKDDKTYKVEVNLSSEKLLQAVDALNFLSSQNTYVEAIAGSVATGKTKASIAGSFAVAVTSNKVKAALGDSVTITTRKGNADVNAADGATTRIIAGSLSAAPAKASVGATVAVLINSDSAAAQTGDNLKINAADDVSHKAEQTGDAQVFTAAMSVAAGADAGSAAGGAINVIVNKSIAENTIGSGATIRAFNNADISSKAVYDLMLLSGSANIAAGGNAKVAAGGTVNVIVDKVKADTTVGSNADINANTNLTIGSDVSDHMVSGALSASAAVSGTGKSGAGAVNVMVSKSAANTTVGGTATLSAATGDLTLKANNDAWMLNATLAAAGSGGSAIGGAFNVNVFDREAKLNLTDGDLTAGGNLFAQSSGRDTTIMAALALSGSVGGSAVSGSVDVLVESNRIRTDIGKGVKATAGKNAVFESYFSDYTVDAAGSIALAGGSAAVGATVVTVVKNNDVGTKLAKSNVTGFGGATAKALNGDAVDGVYVGANASETQFLGAAGIAATTGTAINGVVDVLVNNNKVIADASEAELNINETEAWTVDSVKIRYKKGNYYHTNTVKVKNLANEAEKLRNGTYSYLAYYVDGQQIRVDADNPSFDKIRKNGGITVKATDDTRQILLAGGVSASGSVGAGAAVVTLVSGKEVKALAHDMAAYKDINVDAYNKDNVTMLAISAGLSGGVGVQIGAAVQVLKSKAIAEVGSTVSSKAGSVSITSDNKTVLMNIAAAVALSGSVAVTPAAVVTYFTGESDATLKAGSTVNAANDVNIKATAGKEIDLYSAGASIGGAVGVSGTANVIVSKDKTEAKAEKGTSLTSSAGGLNINAQSEYKLTSATAALAGGTVGVAVNAVISVIKSNTTAELAGKANVKKDMNVKASGSRNITNVGANLGAGLVGAGVNVMVLAAGEKMSQDAADMLVYGNSKSKGSSKTFDADTLLKNIAKGDKGGSKYYKDDLNGSILAADTAGNGHYESQTQVGGTSGSGDKKQGTFDAASGYRSSDFDNSGYNDNGETQRGENLNAKDTDDVANAKKLNVYTSVAPEDAVIARITADAVIEKAENVTVEASQPVTADLYGVTVGAGAVGLGVSAAVAMLHSNVSASSMGMIQDAAGTVTVKAESRSGGNVTDRSSDLKKLLKDLNPASGGIRAIGATVGVGGVSVAVGAAVVLTDNQTQAVLGGTVSSAKNVNVDATQDYGHVTSAVASLSAGLAAVGASVAVAQSEATVTSKIADKAGITAGGDVNVTSTGNQNVTAVAATAGAGLASRNTGIALAINRMTQNTGIGSGASISANNITVKAGSDTTADSFLLGVSLGGSGVALGAATSQVDANVNTEVTGAKLTAAKTIDISNDVVSTSTPKVLSLAGGGLAAGGNILLAFNETTSKASVSDSTIKADTLNVVADLQGKATSELTAAQVGGLAAGLSVNYADIQADNRAVLTNSTVNVKDLLVRTGRSDHDNTSAVANTVAAGMGFLALNLNAAVARNNTKNYAVVEGGDITATNSFKARGYDIPKAEASVTGVNAGALSVAINFVVALNDADTRAVVKLDKLDAGAANFETVSRAQTNVTITTGGGALFKGDANVGVAYGRTTSMVDAQIGKLTATSLTATTIGTDNATAKITNGSYGAVKGSAMMGAAYSQDTFSTKVKLGNGSNVTGETKVATDYEINSDADVTPHKGGLDVSLMKMTVNLAAARNTAYAGSDLTIDGGTADMKNVNVQTTGSGSTNAIIRPVKVDISGVKVAANYANSDLSMTQAATVNLNGATLNADDVNVKSLANKASATASVGTAGASGVSISLANKDLSHAWAKENMNNTAGILGTKKEETRDVLYYDLYYRAAGNYVKRVTEEEWNSYNGSLKMAFRAEKVYVKETFTSPGGTLNAANLNVTAAMKDDNTQSIASATSNGAKDVSFLTLGNLESKATSTDNFNAVMKNVIANATGTMKITANTNTKSTAYGGAPGGYEAISGGISNTYGNVGTSSNKQTAKVLIDEDVKLSANNLTLFAMNQTSVEAKLEKKGGYSLGKVDSSSQPTTTWVETGVIVGKNAELAAKGSLNIMLNAVLNATSKVDAGSTGLVLNVGTMKGKNEIHEDNDLLIGENTKLTSGGYMGITAKTTATMDARSIYSGTYSVWGQTQAEAENRYWRNQTISLANGVTAEAGEMMNIVSDLGTGDTIETHAKETVRSFVELAKARANNYPTAKNYINLGAVNLTSNGTMNIIAQTGGYAYTNGSVDAAGSFKLDAAPTGVSHNEYNLETFVNINRGNLSGKAKLTSKNSEINVKAKLENLHVIAKNFVEGSGLFGGVDAYCENQVEITTTIWADNVDFSGKNGTNLRSNFGEDYRAFFEELSKSALYGVGYERSQSWLKGNFYAKIYTHNRSLVSGGNKFTHIASDTIRHNVDTSCVGWWTSKGKRENKTNYYHNAYCDFCKNDTTDRKFDYNWDIDAKLKATMKKALEAINDINRQVNGKKPVTKARYEEIDDKASGAIYVLALQATLDHDETFGEDRLAKYRLWNNSMTNHDVYLLHNAANLYRGSRLNYISDVLRGDLEDGNTYSIDIFTALNKYAYSHPVIPIGSSGSLDFSTGVFTLPELADFELYLHEVSGKWMTEQFNTGFIRMYSADQEAIDAFALGGTNTLPEDPKIVEGLTELGEDEGWKMFWLGETPETVQDPDEWLIVIYWNEETDEIDAGRITKNMLEADEDPVDVSLYLFRDSKSDRRGEEKYNVLFFDTPVGYQSLVKVVTNVLEGRKLEIPKPIRIVLRGRRIGGADLPVYSLTDHYFAMNDGTDGEVSMFDGFYTATFDGDVFDSAYTRVEGIRDGDLTITLKKNQPIWPEWTDKDSAEDLNGEKYELVDEVWYKEEDVPMKAGA